MWTEERKEAYRGFLKNEELKNNWDSRRKFEEVFRGRYESKGKFAQEWHEMNYDVVSLPEWVQGHLDWNSLGDEIFSYAFYEVDREEGGIFVYENQ